MRPSLSPFLILCVIISAQASSLPFYTQIQKMRAARITAMEMKHSVRPAPVPGLCRSAAEGDTVSGVFGMGTGVISGVLNSPLSDWPDVKLFDEYGYMHGSLSPNNPGTFIFSGLYPGKYTLGVGYEDGWLGNTHDPAAAQWITVSSGQSITVDTIVIPAKTYPPSDTITLSGNLYIGTGISNPFVGTAQLYYNDVSDQHGRGSLTIATDAAGHFSARAPLSTGSWYILFSELSPRFAPVWIGDERIFATPTPVQVSGDLTGIVVHLDAGGTLKGQLIDPDTSLILDYVSLYLFEKNSGVQIGGTSVSGNPYGASGAFTLNNIPAGTYVLMAEVSGNNNLYTSNWFWPGTRNPDSATLITISEGISDSVPFTLKRNSGSSSTSGQCTFAGTVIAPGRSGMRPAITVYQGRSSSSGGNTASGMDYNLTSSKIGIPTSISASLHDIYLPETWYRSSGSTIVEDSATFLTLTNGETRSGLDITMPVGGSIAGGVFDKDGTPLDMYGDMAPMIVATNSSGEFSAHADYGSPLRTTFRMPGVTPGSWNISLRPFTFSEASTVPQQYTAAAIAIDGDPITVSADSTSIAMITATEASGMIRGSILTDKNFNSDDGCILYAVHPDGTVAEMVAIFDDPAYSDANNIPALFHFFHHDSRVNTPSGSRTLHIGAGGLLAGDYSIALAYTINDTLLLRWYGQSTGTPITDFSWGEKMDIPSDAITINLPTSSSLIGNINFDFTPINAPLLTPQMLSLKAITTPAGGLRLSWSGLPADQHAATLTLCSLSGRILFTQNIRTPQGTVSLDSPPASGMYILRLEAGTAGRTMKVMIGR